MSYSIEIENSKGEKLELTSDPSYSVAGIEGLYPPSATINTSALATSDGAKYNSSRANVRNIVIELFIESPVEENRIRLYKYVKTKERIRFYYKNDTRNVFIDGYVESMPIKMFEMKQGVQISIVCPDPYFRDVTETLVDFASVSSLFEFPFAIEESGTEMSRLEVGAELPIVNQGDVKTGVTITLRSSGLVLNPKIYNVTTEEWFILDLEMNIGDVITIITENGKKSVKMVHEGIERNVINDLRHGSKWLQLEPEDNIFTYTADEFPYNLSCQFLVHNKYEGV